jgi:uncharacterized protein YraI
LKTNKGGLKTTIVAAALGLGVVAGSLAGGALVGGAQVSAYACDCETKVTTSALNLRSGPGTNYDVMLVMPEGAKLQAALNPDYQKNGFVKVAYNDNYGWASEDYLADGEIPTGIGSEESIVGTAVTTADVNFRQGPGYDYGIQTVIANGSQVAITDQVVDGFRYVWHAGVDGWVYDVYLSGDGAGGTSGGGSATTYAGKTTDYVNFRSGPGLDQSIIKVLQPGTKVEVTNTVENRFRQVSVNGKKGWIHDDYLA